MNALHIFQGVWGLAEGFRAREDSKSPMSGRHQSAKESTSVSQNKQIDALREAGALLSDFLTKGASLPVRVAHVIGLDGNLDKAPGATTPRGMQQDNLV